VTNHPSLTRSWPAYPASHGHVHHSHCSNRIWHGIGGFTGGKSRVTGTEPLTGTQAEDDSDSEPDSEPHPSPGLSLARITGTAACQ
jgi:hypothetical protein